MALVRGMWKLLVGVKDLLVLLAMLLFFGALYALLSVRPEPIRDGILDLKLAGTIVEQPSRRSPSELLAGGGTGMREHGRRQIVETLNAAASDDRVKGVALDLDRFAGGGQVALGDVGAALDRVRKAGKPVIAYATYYADDGYQLAAHASEIYLDPLGGVALAGPGGSNLYFAGLFDRLGVTAHVYRAGTYKAAVEPFTRRDMSPEARANAEALAGALLENFRDEIARARPAAKIDAALRDPVALVRAAGGDIARAARDNGLVDRLATRRDFEARLAAIGGKGDGRHAYRAIRFDHFADDVADHPAAAPIGLVTVAGTIVDGTAPLGTAGGDSIAEAIEDALDDPALKALVVRVDSPGGSVTASERIRLALLAARDRKLPVVISMGNVAASGGYWIATAGNEVFAQPSTITGSIGVFGVMPSFEGTLAKLGVGVDGIKTTPLSGEPDILAGPSPAVDTLLQSAVDSHYQRFLALVATARGKSPAEIDRIAQGRVWDGGTARQLGLVDRFGNLDAAIDRAGELAGIAKGERRVRLLERSLGLSDRLLGMLADEEDGSAPPMAALRGLAGDPERAAHVAVAELRALAAGPVLQARCLACPAELRAPPPAPSAPASWLALLLAR